MSGGYVLDFSNRTFDEFVEDHTGLHIYHEKYALHGSSKANRLRTFWDEEPNHVVATLVRALMDYANENGSLSQQPPALLDSCLQTIQRLSQATAVKDVDAFSATSDERDFEVIAREVQDAISSNKLESGLDRLHTFVIKYVRTVCTKHGISIDRDKPLHSLFGEYVKALQRSGHLESEMSRRILKSSISILEAFNDVRNDHSLAHDNPVLGYEESLLIFNHVAASMRFLRGLEAKIDRRSAQPAAPTIGDDIPF
jgi:hypothetical protein